MKKIKIISAERAANGILSIAIHTHMRHKKYITILLRQSRKLMEYSQRLLYAVIYVISHLLKS